MKSALRYIVAIGGLASWIAVGFILPAQAQNREKYIISAQAGGINLVSGNVTVLPSGSDRQQSLSSTDDLQTGDIVTTGAGGRVEVLLNPGSYMRVTENSEFELANASLDDLQVRLVKGSAVIEVTGAEGVDLAIGINTPQTDALIVRRGIYRFNVLPGGTTEIIVRKGRVLPGNDAANIVKGGRKALVRRGLAEVAKLNKTDQDSLDLWSKERAELLAKANKRLERRSLLLAFNDYGWGYDGWGRQRRYGRHGLWVYNASARGYCYLPFGAGGWSSPYGYGYGNGIGGYGYGNGGVPGYGPPTAGNGNPPSGGGSGGGNGNVNPSPAPAPRPQPEPSYQPPPSRPMSEPSDRSPRKVFTDGSPNR